MNSPPLQLNQIIGQDAVLQSLRTAWTSQRLPHGLIFAGPMGIGKATTATALGQLFLCENPSDFAACRQCASCKSFEAETHPDFHRVHRLLIRLSKSDSKARDLSTDVVRDFLIAKAANKSVVGRGKVFLVEEADRMNMSGQNSLLKTLEEPAGRTLIILVTSAPEQLLPTIHSRSQLFRFALLDPSLVNRQLLNGGIAPDRAAAVAELSDGSLGLAQQWLRDGVVEQAQQLSEALTTLAHRGPGASIPELLKSATDEYVAKQMEQDDQQSKDQLTREGLTLYLNLAARWASRQLAAGSLPPDSLCDVIDALFAAEQFIDANVNIALVLQQVGGAVKRSLQLA